MARLPWRLLDQLQQARLLGDVPFRIAGAVVWQHRHAFLLSPVAKARTSRRGQMLNDRGAEYFKEKILVRLFVFPAPLRFLFRLRARANGNQNYAVSFRLRERALQSLAANRAPSM